MMDQDATDKLLAAIQGLDKKFDDKAAADEARFSHIEAELDNVIARDRARDTQFATFADSLNKCASAAANAADIGLKAQRSANEVRDEATKIVHSALQIHNASIASSVEIAVKAAVAPLARQVGEHAAAFKRQDGELAVQTELLKRIETATIGNPKLRKAVFVLACVGALVGGAVAGYMAARGESAATHALPH
jgi:hypothetical protein